MKRSEIKEIVSRISYKDWQYRIGSMGNGCFLQVIFEDKCAKDGKMSIQKGRKWYISSFATKSEIIQTAFLAIKTAEEHEMREMFTYSGQRVFGPHMDIEELAQFAKVVPEDARQHLEDENILKTA